VEYRRLSDKELLGRVVGVRNAQRVYRGSLSELLSTAGAGCPMTAKLLAAKELVRRSLAEELARGPMFASPSAVKEFLSLSIGKEEHEVFVVLFLDAQHALIAAEEMFRGTLSQTSVYPREVVKAALRLNAGSVILAHNHPSGMAEPSRADEYLTQTLKAALALVDVRVLDHVIVAGHATVSLAERGLL
jgi:DNA repair protein RadC